MLKAIYITYDGIMEPLGQSQILPYLKGLSGRKIKFFLLSFEKAKYRRDLGRFIAIKKDLDLRGIQWLALNYHKRPLVLSTIYDILCGFACCAFIFLTKRPNLVHSRSYVASLIAWFLKKTFNVKFIFDMRGFWVDERVEGKVWKSRNILYAAAKYVEKRLLEDADEIIVLTNKARDIIKRWGYSIDNVSVIPSGVDTDHFKFMEGPRAALRNKYGLMDKFIFIHTGSLEYWYMKDKMLDYFKICAELFPAAHFLILSHDDHRKIKKLIQDKNLDFARFTILNVFFDNMPEYLSMADAGIFFITPGFSKLASSPTKFAEYLSCGLPVICNNGIGDLEEHVQDDGIGVIVRNFNDHEYKESFQRLLGFMQSGESRTKCRLAACNNFNKRFGVEKYHEIYSRIN